MDGSWVWDIGEIILTDKDRSIRNKNCPTAILSTTNLTRIDLGSNPGLRGEWPSTNYMSRGNTLPYIDISSALRYAVKLRYATLRYVKVPYAMLRYVTLRYIMLRYATIRYATLHFAVAVYHWYFTIKSDLTSTWFPVWHGSRGSSVNTWLFTGWAVEARFTSVNSLFIPDIRSFPLTAVAVWTDPQRVALQPLTAWLFGSEVVLHQDCCTFGRDLSHK
jgi:hypothetical protein